MLSFCCIPLRKTVFRKSCLYRSYHGVVDKPEYWLNEDFDFVPDWVKQKAGSKEAFLEMHR